jgi:hypothetical protein
MQIDTTAALSQSVGTLPTFTAVILAWIQSNARIADTKSSLDKRIDDTNKRFDDLRALIQSGAQATRTQFSAELGRVEESWTPA